MNEVLVAIQLKSSSLVLALELVMRAKPFLEKSFSSQTLVICKKEKCTENSIMPDCRILNRPRKTCRRLSE